MAEGRQRESWQHTSALMALVAQAMGGKQKPDDFNPFAEKHKPLPKMSMKDLKPLLMRTVKQRSPAATPNGQ